MKELYIIKDGDREKVYQMMIRAFRNYPKLAGMFTNGEEDIRFYLKNGFQIVGVTRSEEFGFENTYVMYFPENCEPWTAAEAADE